MATYHFHKDVVSRSQKAKGKASGNARVSFVNKAAYLQGARMHDAKIDRDFDYRGKQKGVAWYGVALPDGAPEWMQDAEALANAVEKTEKRKDSQLGFHYDGAFPREISEQDMIDGAGRWAKAHTDRGRAVILAVHKERASDGGWQWHFHGLEVDRPVDADSPTGFVAKKPSMDGKFYGRGRVAKETKEELLKEREAWGVQLNEALEAAGSEARVDHRSNEARGIDRLPGIHLGPQVMYMQARGIETHKMQRQRVIRAINAARELEAGPHYPAEEQDYGPDYAGMLRREAYLASGRPREREQDAPRPITQEAGGRAHNEKAGDNGQARRTDETPKRSIKPQRMEPVLPLPEKWADKPGPDEKNLRIQERDPSEGFAAREERRKPRQERETSWRKRVGGEKQHEGGR